MFDPVSMNMLRYLSIVMYEYVWLGMIMFGYGYAMGMLQVCATSNIRETLAEE